MATVISALSPPAPLPASSSTRTSGLSQSSTGRTSSTIGLSTSNTSSISTIHVSSTFSSSTFSSSTSSSVDDPLINAHPEPKSTIVLVALCSALAAAVFILLFAIGIRRYCRKQQSNPSNAYPNVEDGTTHPRIEYAHRMPHDERERPAVRPNGQPRDLRSWIDGMNGILYSSEDLRSVRESTGNSDVQKSSSFRIPRKPLPPYPPHTPSSIHTAASQYVTAPSSPPPNITTYVEPLEDQSASAESSITMSAPITSGMAFGGHGKDSPKHSSPSTTSRYSIDPNPRFPSHHRSTSIQKRIVTDPLPIPGARPVTASTTVSFPYEGRTSSDFFHPAPPNVLSTDDTSPTPSSVCLRDHDLTRDSEPERQVLITGPTFAESVDQSSLDPMSQQSGGPGFLFLPKQSQTGFRQMPFIGQEQGWPVRTMSDVGSQGVKVGNIAAARPLVYFPGAQEGIQSARGSVHSGNTHSHPHSLSYTNLHSYIHHGGHSMDVESQRQRTLSLPSERVKRMNSTEMLNERADSDSLHVQSMPKRRDLGRKFVARKEVPRHLLAQVEKLATHPDASEENTVRQGSEEDRVSQPHPIQTGSRKRHSKSKSLSMTSDRRASLS